MGNLLLRKREVDEIGQCTYPEFDLALSGDCNCGSKTEDEKVKWNVVGITEVCSVFVVYETKVPCCSSHRRLVCYTTILAAFSGGFPCQSDRARLVIREIER